MVEFHGLLHAVEIGCAVGASCDVFFDLAAFPGVQLVIQVLADVSSDVGAVADSNELCCHAFM